MQTKIDQCNAMESFKLVLQTETGKIISDLYLQPAFVNNPLMGLVILAALFVFHTEVGLGCMLGGLTATIVELVVGLHPWADLANGVACFNGVLVGTVIPILYPAFYHTGRTLAMWLAVFGGSIVR